MTDFDFKEFKRMNFFTGLFTTAEDWNAEQKYHREKLKLHNRAAHTPGVMRGVLEELRVIAVGNKLQVQRGAAIDGDGNEIFVGEAQEVLPSKDFSSYTQETTVYVTLQYAEVQTDPVVNVTPPKYEGNARWTETVKLSISDTKPDNKTVLELARIQLRPPVSAVANPLDSANPKANEIDGRQRNFAGSVCELGPEQWLDPDTQQRLILIMLSTRKAFAALDGRFPTPSAKDVRQAALTVEMLARIGFMRIEDLAGLFFCIADVENDVGQETAASYPVLTKMQIYQDYLGAVDTLQADIKGGISATYLNSQDRVSQIARELSEIIITPPEAEPGMDQTVSTAGDEAGVTLDASASKAFGGRKVALFQWNLKSSALPPRADAGRDGVIMTERDEEMVVLDGSGSRVLGGGRIEKYRWDKR